LICARDQLGVRPLFYAQAGNNQAETLGSSATPWPGSPHSPASDLALDDTWIGDFLGVGGTASISNGRSYRHIHRLPPAHVLTLSPAGRAVRRYWRLEIGDPIQHADPRQYTEQFNEAACRAPSPIGCRPAGSASR